jgi:hypothetical protein
MLFRIGGALTLLFGSVQFFAWLRWRNRASLWWTAANCTGTAGATLFLGHGILPDWAGRTAANTLILSATLMVWLGFRSFTGLPQRPRTAAAAALLFLVVFESLRLLAHDLGALILCSSVALGLVNARTALDLARAWPGPTQRLRQFLVWVFALHALFYLFRMVTAFTVEAGTEFLTLAGVQTTTLLLGVAEVLIWNTSSIWMVAERRRGAVTAPVAV